MRPNHVKDQREQKGLSKLELAFYSGVSLPTIERLERGDGHDPQLETAGKLAKALGVTIADLFPFEEVAS